MEQQETLTNGLDEKELKPGTQWSSNHFITTHYVLCTMHYAQAAIATKATLLHAFFVVYILTVVKRQIDQWIDNSPGRKYFGTHRPLLDGNTEREAFCLFTVLLFCFFSCSRNMICFPQEIWSSPCPSCKWRVGDWENTQLVNTLQCLHWPSTQSCFNAVCQHYSIPISLLQLFLYYNNINIATI